ncbi:hypothetical protein AcW1_010107 [Taiwanofungus camphoratus]|nr:hypothetical protein AcW1_010107 [Antrodia cinnamomea]
MAKLSRVKPFTPTVRRFLLDVFKPTPPLLGKRNRDDDDDVEAQTRDRVAAGPASQPARVALQNDDDEEDAVVITALNVVPFCCHADLITMSRTHLLAVANTLNAKLPRALQIDVSPSRSDVFIRNSIEMLVGLRRSVPQAPKAVRSLSMRAQTTPQSPGSPLATKTRSNLSADSPALAVLREEDENMPDVERPQKKRRFNSTTTSDGSPQFDPGRRITRSQSHRVAPMYTSSSIQARVLRTRSQKLPDKKPMIQGTHPNITTTRGRTGSRAASCPRSRSSVMTSTPKKRILGDADPNHSTGALAYPAAALTSASLAPPMATHTSKKGRAIKRKASVDDTIEVTFGIDGMTMAAPISNLDMDISAE